ncbi:hypothetical protein RJ639_030658 [Escallonia herrerae]|uniref:Uncharacterized protein n=1 Tax=Escallonia herrerae TaxID=1293975 RepID=A0AA88RUP8_9ASTE|nr:hypothetical protein RJ639_026429 [Escallonia herrerae]KAK3037953.1 hypothetical protein RJ639_030658 [Escallonia herrerae]
MAIDGSFHLQFEFERFLSRCPKLAHQTQFSHLLKKGDMLTEEEVVSGVAELFLHPNYTIPLVGCFRAIAQKIVDRTVELLRLVPDLSLNSDDSMVEFDEDKFLGETESSDNQELLFGIDIYVRNGRGLSLHELGCLAFSRALDLVPFLLGSVLNYFKFAPPPFQRIMLRELVSSPTAMVGNNLLMVVRVSYRLLLAEPEAFTVLWDWSTLVGLEKQFSNVKLCDDAEFLRNVLDIRWCATQILAVVMKISDRATANFGLDAEEAFACFLRWNEFLRDVSSEKAGWYSQLFEGNESAAISSSIFQEIEPLFGSSRPLTW